MNFGQEDRHAPATTVQYWSDGDTIPYIVGSGEELVGGDVVERVAANNQIGVVQQVTDPHALDAANQKATEGDRVELRVKGAIRAPIADPGAGGLADGARLKWNTTNSNFEANATGAHEYVGTAADDDTYGLVRINVFGDAFTP